ncbi:hypothetical protein CCHR01_02903 [Colletotrichum chrysophilum]|uniref:Uncharacterized protein n=1 Tax=Colletotrichum chrysophilum TaxID=1836956 RepID=A0AAD9EN86_9PEZI|nr:hypothetical protein CCHR01_02903 [Colletotrichum chrysophilum]
MRSGSSSSSSRQAGKQAAGQAREDEAREGGRALVPLGELVFSAVRSLQCWRSRLETGVRVADHMRSRGRGRGQGRGAADGRLAAQDRGDVTGVLRGRGVEGCLQVAVALVLARDKHRHTGTRTVRVLLSLWDGDLVGLAVTVAGGIAAVSGGTVVGVEVGIGGRDVYPRSGGRGARESGRFGADREEQTGEREKGRQRGTVAAVADPRQQWLNSFTPAQRENASPAIGRSAHHVDIASRCPTLYRLLGEDGAMRSEHAAHAVPGTFHLQFSPESSPTARPPRSARVIQVLGMSFAASLTVESSVLGTVYVPHLLRAACRRPVHRDADGRPLGPGRSPSLGTGFSVPRDVDRVGQTTSNTIHGQVHVPQVKSEPRTSGHLQTAAAVTNDDRHDQQPHLLRALAVQLCQVSSQQACLDQEQLQSAASDSRNHAPLPLLLRTGG